jgi:hypothetical protein
MQTIVDELVNPLGVCIETFVLSINFDSFRKLISFSCVIFGVSY